MIHCECPCTVSNELSVFTGLEENSQGAHIIPFKRGSEVRSPH
jgi:hypothetical protein